MNPTPTPIVTPARPTRGQRGFSLIEIMVGVAIALIGMVVIFQVLTVWDARKRTTSSGSDAQIAGSIAMFNLERDLKLAGLGFASSTYMGCTVQAYDASRATPAFTFGLYPVQIIDGAAGAPDRIVVLYGGSAFYSSAMAFTVSGATTKRTQAGRSGFQMGELGIVAGNAPPGDCALVEFTGYPAPPDDGLTLHHASGNYTNFLGQAVTSRYNPAAGTGGTFAAGILYNLGPAQQWAGAPPLALPHLNTWQICRTALANCAAGSANNALAWSDGLHDAATWSEVAEGIINLQAEYGVDGDNNNMITSAAPNEWSVAAPADWTKVLAARVAVLARSQQYERTAVYAPAGCAGAGCTPRAPEWAGGFFTMTNADGSADSSPADPNDWRHYRYRVYEQLVPLRNMIWR